MIVLAAGMPRAGSGWHYNLIHDLVLASGGQNARAIRRRFFLSRILTEVNCNIRALSAKRVLPVLIPSLFGNTFAIKTHSGPTAMALRLIRNGRLRVSYIYRDPRAALLSAYEYGERARAVGGRNAFAKLATIEQAIDFMQGYLRIWQQWMAVEGIHKLRYEDFLLDYENQSANLAKFLGADLANAKVEELLIRYNPEEARRAEKGRHFQQGEAERFRRELTASQLESVNQAVAPHLKEMGYPL